MNGHDQTPASGVGSGQVWVDEDEISLLDLMLVLAKRWRMIVGGTFLVALLAVVIALVMKDQFTANVTVMPPQKSSGGAAALLAGQLGAMAGVGGDFGGGSADLYEGLLKSRTVTDSLIMRFHLMQVYHSKTLDDARKVFAANLAVTADKKSSLIKIEFTDRNPRRAADVANAAVAVLNQVVSHLAITQASQKRAFFEQQVHESESRLNKDEVALSQMGQGQGWIELYPQEREVAASNAQLRAQIAAKEVELSAMQISVTPNNPDYLRLQQTLQSLRAKLHEQPESGVDGRQKKSPQSLVYLQKYRDVLFEQEVLKLMMQQYETAKVDEAKDFPVVQVVDPALVPERHSKPKRALIVIVGGMLGMFLCVVWAFVAESLQRAGDDPETAEKMRQIRVYLRGH